MPRDQQAARARLGKVVLRGDKSAIPSEDSLGLAEGTELGELRTTQALGGNGEPTPMRICEPATRGRQLLPKNFVLGAEIVDGELQFSVEPAGHEQNDEVQGRRHAVDYRAPWGRRSP